MAKNYRSELVGTFGNPIDENPTGVVMERRASGKEAWIGISECHILLIDR